MREFLGGLKLLPAFFQASHCVETPSEMIVSEGIIGVQRDGPSVFFLRSRPVKVIKLRETQFCSSFRRNGVKGHCFPSGSSHNGEVLARWPGENVMGLGQSDVSQCEIGRGIDGLLEALPSRSQLLIAEFHPSLPQMVMALEICIEGLGIQPWGLRSWHLVWRRDSRLDLTGDIAGYIGLERESVAHVPLVAFGPQIFVRRPLDQLRGDAHVIAGVLHRSLDNPIHAQLTRDFR